MIGEKEPEFSRTGVNTRRWVLLPHDVPMVGGASKLSHASIMIGKLEGSLNPDIVAMKG
jgi:hypothetical protein